MLQKQKRSKKRFVEKARILDLLREHLAAKERLNVTSAEVPLNIEEEDILILDTNEFSEAELNPPLNPQ